MEASSNWILTTIDRFAGCICFFSTIYWSLLRLNMTSMTSSGFYLTLQVSLIFVFFQRKLEFSVQYDASKLAVINIRDLEGVKNAINVITPDGARIFQCISPKTKVNLSRSNFNPLTSYFCVCFRLNGSKSSRWPWSSIKPAVLHWKVQRSNQHLSHLPSYSNKNHSSIPNRLLAAKWRSVQTQLLPFKSTGVLIGC